MTTIFSKIGAFVLPAAALSLTGLGLASGTAADTDETANSPMQCQIAVSRAGFGHTFQGVLKTTKTVEGFYELNLTQRQGGFAVISQSGPFRVKAGDTKVLGQATFGTDDPDTVEAEFILHVGGQKYACGTQTEI